MKHWHYQVMRHGGEDYAVHEVYPLEDGDAWTQDPVTVTGSSVEDLKKSLIMMLNDIDRYAVKDYE